MLGRNICHTHRRGPELQGLLPHEVISTALKQGHVYSSRQAAESEANELQHLLRTEAPVPVELAQSLRPNSEQKTACVSATAALQHRSQSGLLLATKGARLIAVAKAKDL